MGAVRSKRDLATPHRGEYRECETEQRPLAGMLGWADRSSLAVKTMDSNFLSILSFCNPFQSRIQHQSYSTSVNSCIAIATAIHPRSNQNAFVGAVLTHHTPNKGSRWEHFLFSVNVFFPHGSCSFTPVDVIKKPQPLLYKKNQDSN